MTTFSFSATSTQGSGGAEIHYKVTVDDSTVFQALFYYKLTTNTTWEFAGAGSTGTQSLLTDTGYTWSVTLDIRAIIYISGSPITSVDNIITTPGSPSGGNLPGPITGLTAVGGDHQVKVSWNAASNAIVYYVVWTPSHNGGVASTSATEYTATGLTNGTTYLFEVWGINYDGDGPHNYVNGVPSATGRPTNFSWTVTKVTNGDYKVTASEWNEFTAKIDKFREYKGLYFPYGFTTVNVNDEFAYWIFNQAVNGMAGMGASGVPSTVSSGDLIYASVMNQLVNALNSIP